MMRKEVHCNNCIYYVYKKFKGMFYSGCICFEHISIAQCKNNIRNDCKHYKRKWWKVWA